MREVEGEPVTELTGRRPTGDEQDQPGQADDEPVTEHELGESLHGDSKAGYAWTYGAAVRGKR
ncbi:MAG: hypothetical protein H0X18_10175 [Geodermatophilaceae bacterium]|nr:hypothetical protein [Geodermatophilaceae bacterium]